MCQYRDIHTRDEQSLDAFRFVVLARDVEGSVSIVVTHVQSGTIWSALGTESLRLRLVLDEKWENKSGIAATTDLVDLATSESCPTSDLESALRST